MPVTLVWRTDVHLSDHTPRSRTDNWTETVLRKLASVGNIARDVNAHAVIDGGDFFDIKAPGRNSHALIQRVMAVHRDYPCPVYANVGNHDCVYGDYSYLPQQPLGVLYEAGTFRRLYDEHEAVFTLPGIKVRVVGVPYHGVKYDMDRLARIKRGDEDYLVVVCHLLASPTQSTMFDAEDVIRYDVLDNYPDVDVWAFGHWHKDQGIERTPGGKTVVNIGSLTRGALSQDSLDRVPSVAVMRFDRDGFTVEKLSVPHAPASDVFDLEKRDKEQIQQTMIEEFVDHLSQTFAPSAQKSLTDAVRDIPGVPDSVREKAINYIERAGGR
jgi:exonuclease SbcD